MKTEEEVKQMLRELVDEEVINDNIDDFEYWDGEELSPYVYTENGVDYYFINMNDMFAWACADSEQVTLEELINAYEYVQKRKGEEPEWKDWTFWVEWVGKRRKMPPQLPVLMDMAAQEHGVYRRLKVPWYNENQLETNSKYFAIKNLMEKDNIMKEDVQKILDAEYKNYSLVYKD